MMWPRSLSKFMKIVLTLNMIMFVILAIGLLRFPVWFTIPIYSYVAYMIIAQIWNAPTNEHNDA
jgi:hypothetical protein